MALSAGYYVGKPGTGGCLWPQHLSGSRELVAGFRDRSCLLDPAVGPVSGSSALVHRLGYQQDILDPHRDRNWALDYDWQHSYVFRLESPERGIWRRIAGSRIRDNRSSLAAGPSSPASVQEIIHQKSQDVGSGA